MGKKSGMMNTGLWISIGKTGQQQEKMKKSEYLSNQKNSDH
jgi:hypothetical protein